MVTGLVFLGWWLLTDEPIRRAAAMSCIAVAVFFLLGGGTLMGRVTIVGGASRWGIAGERYQRVYEDETPGEGLTFLGASLIIGPQLFVVALLLLE